MKFIVNASFDIYEHLAVEEFLLKNKSDDFFYIWQADNAIVSGKHQNVYKEINLKYASENNIKIARRISGGGTVFHDKGNVNFCFILNKQKGKVVDFRLHTQAIIEFLQYLGLKPGLSSRNDIFLNNKKISGNAEHIYKNRVLHHGTLLVNSNLELLYKVLQNNKTYIDKSINSVKKTVANISDFLPVSTSVFVDELQKFLSEKYNARQIYLSETEQKQIENLAETKYNAKEWIFLYNSDFELYTKIKGVEFTFKIKKSNIYDIETFGENNFSKKIKSILLNKAFFYEEIDNILNRNMFNKNDADAILSALF